jgi:hypothetical protein
MRKFVYVIAFAFTLLGLTSSAHALPFNERCSWQQVENDSTTSDFASVPCSYIPLSTGPFPIGNDCYLSRSWTDTDGGCQINTDTACYSYQYVCEQY